MDAELLKALAEIVAAGSWPILAIVVIILFKGNLRNLLNATKSITIKSGRNEVIFSRDIANHALEELWNDVVELTDGLTKCEKVVFHAIATSCGRRTVKELFPDFARSSEKHENCIHQILRKLRDCRLIRPSEENSWRDYKHPIVTRFGKLVLHLKPGL